MLAETNKSTARGFHDRQVAADDDDDASSLNTLKEAVGNLTPWGHGYLRLYICMGFLSLVATMNGFDGSLMGSLNALPSFQDFYGLGPDGAAKTGIVFAIVNVGQIVGALFAWLNDWHGRRPAIFIGCFGVCLGGIITATSPTLSGLVIGRFFLATCSTIATTATPMLLVEIAPPQYRGFVSGFYNTIYYLGSTISSVTVYAFNSSHFSRSDLAWRIPLWLQIACPALVCVGVFCVPESPRWLISRNRIDEARAMISKYHANGDEQHPIVGLQMQEMQRSVLEEGDGTQSFRAMLDVRALFRSKARRYRTMLLVAFSWIAQFSGNNVISYYLPLLSASVGITSTRTQLLLNVAYSLSGWACATAGALLQDYYGRRKMFLSAILGMVLTLTMVTVGTSFYVNHGDLAATLVSIIGIFLFGAVFATGFTAMQPIYPGEVMTNDMRAKGMALFQIVSGVASFVNTFAAPVALRNIGYWFYVFFILWDVFEGGFVYLFFVETKGRTLEEMDSVFAARNPRKASTRRRVTKTEPAGDEGA